MNPDLDLLQPYPFQRLASLFGSVVPNPALRPISLGIGEPKHPTPERIRAAITANLDGLATYPATAGSEALRRSMADWLVMRHGLPGLDWKTQVLPVNGSREALFAIAQTIVDRTRASPLVVSPNPFYQIYEGATLLAGARAAFLNQTQDNGFRLDLGQLSEDTWSRTQLLFVCSPGNPAGAVLTLDDWRALFALSDRHGFVIVSDECYSEIFFDDAAPPLGGLGAAVALGRTDFPRLVVLGSLSKRSNCPGMRSGLIAGDATIIERFLLYRTYHGCAMSPTVQAASIAAWNDESHVVENRRMYREKFDAVIEVLAPAMPVQRPDGGFYLWLETPGADTDFARDLYLDQAVTVLPGSYLAREAHGINPGLGRVRAALVAPVAECVEAATRLAAFVRNR
ncbi:MAG: succinyldiaminopimelate transaminase [Rhodocyclaceae bacterium]|nr:succinyldiaminopimelate transaminase [Rhodocyclaceae bacterium]MCA3074673.1 succinyldiaminopimelate transaminase [Rhodocyclaceae bacterium]MCA3088854.1 succinyldiaminopimelate transaminase [Rhodocyclaceae bacterium]MCA3095590.1 succinyldiaminopimelate transaminase [Rhodocyclaceae bacterium]MCA3097597.1 succinyldiaminopimelate transaminase [Rhodocyclaceae bacterium]